MADVIFVCPRRERPGIEADVGRRAALRLAPPGGLCRTPLLLHSAGAQAIVANPTDEGVRLHESPHAATPGTRAFGEPVAGAPAGAVCVGGLGGAPSLWWKVGSRAPEGTYALARWDPHVVELLTDICGSRTIWYVFNDDVFIASTSQRAVVMLLGSFEQAPDAAPSFLLNGNPGVEVSWDARLRFVPPDSRVVLERGGWHVSERRGGYDAKAVTAASHVHVARLRTAIDASCAGLDIDDGKWALALSGGQDSRVLLSSLTRNGLRPRCVTWATRDSLRNPLSDSCIARRLARRLGVDHEVLILEDTGLDAAEVLSRFVAVDEGRNDEIAGYLDGCAVWDELAAAGVRGVIRGDESMGGRYRPRTFASARQAYGGAFSGDYPPDHLVRRLGIPDHRWPERLKPRAGERLIDYSIRMEQQVDLSVYMAGLTGAKARYVEIVNPLLSRHVITVVRSLPPQLRDRAQAYNRIADAIAPSIPYARATSTPSVSTFLASAGFLELAARELSDPSVERILPPDRARLLLAALGAPSRPPSLSARVRGTLKAASRALPVRVADRLYPGWAGPESLDAGDLAFRVVLAKLTVDLFDADARALPLAKRLRTTGEVAWQTRSSRVPGMAPPTVHRPTRCEPQRSCSRARGGRGTSAVTQEGAPRLMSASSASTSCPSGSVATRSP